MRLDTNIASGITGITADRQAVAAQKKMEERGRGDY